MDLRSHWNYYYNSMGKLAHIVDKAGVVTRYSYDSVGRVDSVWSAGQLRNVYTWDANGNRLSANGVTAAYDDQDRLLSYGSRTFGWTPDGSLSSETGPQGARQYHYDSFGNLQWCVLEDGTRIDYVIDPRNRRVGR